MRKLKLKVIKLFKVAQAISSEVRPGIHTTYEAGCYYLLHSRGSGSTGCLSERMQSDAHAGPLKHVSTISEVAKTFRFTTLSERRQSQQTILYDSTYT